MCNKEIINKVISIAAANNYILPDNFRYINNRTKFNLYCVKHGPFKINYSNLLTGRRCPACSGRSKAYSLFKFEQTIVKDRHVTFGKAYKFIKANSKVNLKCIIHGDFWLAPNTYMRGHGCAKCANNSIHKAKQDFLAYCIKEDISIIAKYSNVTTPVEVRCNVHKHKFKLIPKSVHFKVHACPICTDKYHKKKKARTFNRVKKIVAINHKKLSLLSITYKSKAAGFKLRCNEHGIEFRTSYKNIMESSYLCPKCMQVGIRSSGEKYTYKLLKYNNIEFIEQFRANWLGLQSIDFYLLGLEIYLEVQGGHHYLNKTQQERDKRKREKISNKGYKLIEVNAYKAINGAILQGNTSGDIYFSRLANALQPYVKLKKLPNIV